MGFEWEGILRCQTWNVWPEFFSVEMEPLEIDYGCDTSLQVRIAVGTWEQRTTPELYELDATKYGPLLWDGELHGVHQVWDTVLNDPEEVTGISARYRQVRRGELDIWLTFEYEDESLPPRLVETLRSLAYQIVALLNLELADYLIPALPFQVRRTVADDESVAEYAITVTGERRHALSPEALHEPLIATLHFLTNPEFGGRHRVALELYFAHFRERQATVRFILLVIAIEALARPAKKHAVARQLLRRWQSDLEDEKARFAPDSDEFRSLDALSDEFDFRSRDSIQEQINRLFADIPELGDAERAGLQSRAREVYSKRSKLVHDGHLPSDELPALEKEARQLLQLLLKAAIKQSQPEASRFTVHDGPTRPVQTTSWRVEEETIHRCE